MIYLSALRPTGPGYRYEAFVTCVSAFGSAGTNFSALKSIGTDLTACETGRVGSLIYVSAKRSTGTNV